MLFDSGVGGLSVLDEIRQLRSDLDFHYVLDNAAFPYGLLSESVLIERVATLMCRLVEQHHPSLIVIACNTASTLVLPVLRQQLAIPVVGVVPAIKPAAQFSDSGSIGLLATPATVTRPYIDDLVAQFAATCDVLRLGSTRLVTLAERKLRGELVSVEDVASELALWDQERHLDTVVLGCTHFPLLREELQMARPDIKHWVDSGLAIARRVDSLLQQPRKAAVPAEKNSGQAGALYCTREDDHFVRLLPTLQQRYGFSQWQQIDLAATDLHRVG